MKPSYENPAGGPLRDAPDPQRSTHAKVPTHPYIPGDQQGTGYSGGTAEYDATGVGLWLARHKNWKDAFLQDIWPKLQRNWDIYRSHDTQPLAGPNSEWRDRTVLPEGFKLIENDVARTALGQFAGREWFAVQGRDGEDQEHEHKVRELIKYQFDSMGAGMQGEAFIKRMVDALRYRAIAGHVFLEPRWDRETRRIKRRVIVPTEDGETTRTEEMIEVIREGVNVDWLPLDSVAIDVSGARKWAIKMVRTSLESLRAEERNYREEFPDGPPLFEEGALDLLETVGAGAVSKESPEEPRDTEHWPLNQEEIVGDPAETLVELWICYDNIERTCTKIANKSVVLAHGYADTPDGFDPFISVPYIPVPNRVYGESILHYIGPLIQMQTRIARSRMDEVLLNIWQQMLVRQGAVRSTAFFFTPGGALSVETANPDRPITDSVSILPRRPVFTEAWTEEGHRQRQAELAIGNDSMMQGGEATTKSRDVSATEAQQRVLQGNARKQLEAVYLEHVLKRPLLQKTYDLIRMHMTQPKTLRVLGEGVEVNLQDLERPIDIVVGGGIREYVSAERRQQMDQLLMLLQNQIIAQYIKVPPILEKIMELNEWANPEKYVKTQEEVEREQQQRMAQEAATQAMARQGQGGMGGPSGVPQLPEPALPRPEAGLAGADGGEAEPPPEATDTMDEVI